MLLFISDFFQTIIPLISSYWLYQRYSIEKSSDRRFWLFLALATLSFAVAMLIWSCYEIILHIIDPFPTIADIFWNLMNVLLFTAFMYLIIQNRKTLRVNHILYDASIIFVVAFFSSWEFLFLPLLNDSLNPEILDKLMGISYPIGDLIVLFGLLCLYYTGRTKYQPQVFWFISLGIFHFLLADTVYLSLITNGSYYTGHPVELLWAVGLLLVGLSSFFGTGKALLPMPGPQRIGKTTSWGAYALSPRLVMPYFGVLLLFLLTVFQEKGFNSMTIGSIIAIVLILCRQIYTLAENRRLLGQLTELNKDLEQSVHDRTVALRNKNLQLKKSIQQAEYLAYHDYLTGLPNFRYFYKQLNDTLEEAKQKEEQVAILFLDLDRFKLINDSFGHSVGDLLLRQTAARLRTCVGDSGILCRQGGDEFLLFVPNTSQNKAAKLAKDLLESLQQVTKIQDQELIVTSSIGVSLFPDHGEEADLLIQRADTAMYSAKKALRNRFAVYHSSLTAGTAAMLHLERDLRFAVERQEFFLVYQPFVQIETGQITGVEALVRWKHPSKGIISPQQFIPVAEETGLIIPMGVWILETSCRQWRTWKEQGLPPLTMAVNVSINQFMDEQYLTHVRRIIDETGMDPNYLELEITENIPFASSYASHVVQELFDMGVRLSIDDFGTGYSSLQYLKKLPIHTLKIDQSFIQELPHSSSDASIVQTILSMAKHMHLQVIAEGVETMEQLAFLQQHHCHAAQGYYFSKPLALMEIEELLTRSQAVCI